MPQQLPLIPSIPHSRVSTTLAGAQYLLDVRWNARASAWFMDLLAEDETPICHGIKVVLGAAMGGRSTHPRFPAGMLMAVDLTGQGREAGFDDIGTRVVVYFFTAEDLA